ncbi:hypothetical protein F3B51_13630 [Bacteroides ovatus]|uniref:Uncharacterized protein n=1 Tax=Bacteroides ovatus TaxID=28116 RepID=A0A5N4EUM3_BACOV|nr:hypothetical protein F3B68_13430 [Bacteroides ovatus]KAA4565317.1 hypothetical protein F3C56_12840 [Bacteroides ovatus]KAA4570240.1 hypothetical protein F3B65_12960 [Bacteroides ovatus]KAA4578070.1 hypothetical protein F3B64_14155 [Bacteroides ovatus]KAA4580085.1 hypothetical protein F3C21_13480 [Bacteroides ovatus]
MLYNINPISLHCVFHGIRFKVNKDWLSGIDSLLFFIPPSFVFSHPNFIFSSHLCHFYPLFIKLLIHLFNENIIFARFMNVKRNTN